MKGRIVVMLESGQAYATADATIATMFGGGRRGFSELGMGANVATEYDERPPAAAGPQSGSHRTPRSSKEKIAFGFERRMGGAGGAVRTPRSFKGEMATSPIFSQGVAPSIASPHAKAGGQLLPPLPDCHVGRGARWRWLVAANRRRASVGNEDM